MLKKSFMRFSIWSSTSANKKNYSDCNLWLNYFWRNVKTTSESLKKGLFKCDKKIRIVQNYKKLEYTRIESNLIRIQKNNIRK